MAQSGSKFTLSLALFFSELSFDFAVPSDGVSDLKLGGHRSRVVWQRLCDLTLSAGWLWRWYMVTHAHSRSLWWPAAGFFRMPQECQQCWLHCASRRVKERDPGSSFSAQVQFSGCRHHQAHPAVGTSEGGAVISAHTQKPLWTILFIVNSEEMEKYSLLCVFCQFNASSWYEMCVLCVSKVETIWAGRGGLPGSWGWGAD